MKKTMIVLAVVGVAALALGAAGFAYAQADAPATPFGRGGAMRWAADGEYGPMHDVMAAAIADALGLTVEELEAAHAEGKTAWDLAQEQGLTADEFGALMLDARSEALTQAVADGAITQEQADYMQNRWQAMQESGYGPGSSFCDGSGSRGGRGMHGGYWSTQP